ncbi:cutinase transcription factor 1 beta [Amylocarpus encephaloides]|uniref:Cutinase transcription factor 1 beta n=1 Tax=Amylocarpus encephaloides TaxID=45428 RepID=A0A9P8C347_9HELO|nr:cutinase transcription factor 1 beta [Amylocarpus encephaloides]
MSSFSEDSAAPATQLHTPESQSPSGGEDNTTKKRTSSTVGTDKDGNPKPVKRRAAKACAACRARKVRCDVTQRYHVTDTGHATCSNCTMDGIKCVIEESKRRKKQISNGQIPAQPQDGLNLSPHVMGSPDVMAWTNEQDIVNPSHITNGDVRSWSESSVSNSAEMGHQPHSIYQSATVQINNSEMLLRQSHIQGQYEADPNLAYSLLKSASITGDMKATRLEPSGPSTPGFPMEGYSGGNRLRHRLPEYIKPLPSRMTSVDIDYLYAKGALSIPSVPVRNALLLAYLEYVHPYMPLINICEALNLIADDTGSTGKMSLLLFQSIMFAGTAFVDIKFLRAEGHKNRKLARKAFFQKSRVLYDFDYESDRIILVQSILLMTYWYETPDDQKDTWHWMGVAISLAHTIGLHRNPEKSNMDPERKKLWKRIWWSTFMRDRLVALGMRRPTRVKDEDFDVPMLTLDDFETQILPDTNQIIPLNRTAARDSETQLQLAEMCIAKAKLCLCISHILTAQYSVLIKHQGMQGQEGPTRSSVMLFPKKMDQTEEVQRCDAELSEWVQELPKACQYPGVLSQGTNGHSLFVQRSLLHMVYYTALSALHRPQVLPSSSGPNQPDSSRELQDLSRKSVREASTQITEIARNLHVEGLDRFLPTTGVTVLIPAIIIHLLDAKSSDPALRKIGANGYWTCSKVMERLRCNYASADFAIQFLDAAARMANLDISAMRIAESTLDAENNREATHRIDQLKELALVDQTASPPGLIRETTPQEETISTPTENVPSEPYSSTLAQACAEPEPFHDPNLLNISSANPTDDFNSYFNFNESSDTWADLTMIDGAHGESGMDINWDFQTNEWERPDGDLFGGNQIMVDISS